MRTSVITGSSSGIGAATRARLERDGHRVIGVDLHDAEVVADLSTADGRADAVAAISDLAPSLDVVISNAGVMGRGADTIGVNYFGAVAMLDELRPLLAEGDRPRAAATASLAVVTSVDDDLVGACLAGDEAGAHALATSADRSLDEIVIYASAKRALARWVRTQAPSPAWAGAGIALNAVAPGLVRTGMTERLFTDPELAGLVDPASMPFGGPMDADAIAATFAFLTDPATTHLTGQVVFVDSGNDCIVRGDDVFR